MSNLVTPRKVVRTGLAYRDVLQDMQGRIGRGEWPAGSMLPGMRKLAAEYEVSHITVRQAVNMLVQEGALKAEVGRGTFVSDSQGIAKSDRPTQATDVITPTQTTVRSLLSIGPVGVIAWYDSSDEWTLRVLDSLENSVVEAGGRAVYFNLFSLTMPYPTIAQAVAYALEQGAQSLVFVSVAERPLFVDQITASVDIDHVPYVIVGWEDIRVPVPHVFYDNEYAGYLAAQHLIQAGCETIAFLEPAYLTWARLRALGATHAVRQAGLPADSLHLLTSESFVTSSDRAVRLPYLSGIKEVLNDIGFFSLLTSASQPVGIIAGNDDIAAHVMDVMTSLDRKAGRDYAIIGFDDRAEFRVLGLSSLRPPLEDMGRAAARLLAQWLRGERGNIQVRLCSRLMPRASTHLSIGK